MGSNETPTKEGTTMKKDAIYFLAKAMLIDEMGKEPSEKQIKALVKELTK